MQPSRMINIDHQWSGADQDVGYLSPNSTVIVSVDHPRLPEEVDHALTQHTI